jgi:hypothetical protein
MRSLFLDNQAIKSLAKKREVRKVFPFFGKTIKKSGCCGKITIAPDYDFIKSATAALTTEGIQTLKTLLKVEAIRVFLPNGRDVTLT